MEASSNGFHLQQVLRADGALSPQQLVETYEQALRAAPVGLTVVDAAGRVLYTNEFQNTFRNCPWAGQVGMSLVVGTAVPASVRSALRRMLRSNRETSAPPSVLRLTPVSFAADERLYETWLIPVRSREVLRGVLMIQHEQGASRLFFPSGSEAPDSGDPQGPVPIAERGSPVIELEALRREFRLTARELQVVNALCRGMATQAIAQEMQISNHTVKDYLKRIQRKMDARGRLAIVVKAMTASR